MAVTFTQLTEGVDTNADLGTTADTASITPTNGATVFVVIEYARGSAIGTNTGIAGDCISGAAIATDGTTSARTTVADQYGLEIWKATGTGVADTITITGSNAKTGWLWKVIEVAGDDTTDPVVQVVNVTNAAEDFIAVTMAAYASASNRVLFAGIHNAGGSTDPHVGAESLTEIGTQQTDTAPASRLSLWEQLATDTTLTIDWDTTNRTVCGICIEVAAAAGSAVALTGKDANASAGRASTQVNLALTGKGTAATTGTGQFQLNVGLSGSGAASSAGNADMTVERETIRLAGSGAASSAGTATMSLLLPMTGSGTASSAGIATPSLSAVLAGSGTASSTGRASADISVMFSGAGAASSAGRTAANLLVGMSGHGAASTTGNAPIQLVMVLRGHGDAASGATASMTVTEEDGVVVTTIHKYAVGVTRFGLRSRGIRSYANTQE
jgi:hypothetical protein